MKFRHLLSFLGAFAMMTNVPAPVKAIPAWPGRLTHVQPDGTVLDYRIVGDEHWHTLLTSDGYEIAPDGHGALCYVIRHDGSKQLLGRAHNAVDRTAAETFALPQPWAGAPTHASAAGRSRQPRRLAADGFPTTGEVRGMVMLVEFADRHFQTENTQSMYTQLMNDEGYTGRNATGSARDYFVSQSTGLFTPHFDVVGPIRLSHDESYYGGDDEYGTDAGAGQMVEEACRLALEQGIDFSQYDYNSDGDVDFVFFIYAGYGQQYGAPSETIWPHTATLPDWGITLTLDGKRISRYACGSELKYSSGTQLEGIGTFCHEFGHVLGLPDFYDTRHQNGTRLGVWDIMDQGCYNNESRTPCAYSAFERMSLGWLTLTELSEPADNVELPELTQTNTAYRISTSRPDEYFVLENRQQVGWDAYQPARGMLVAHVDYDKTVWDQNTVNNGSDMRYDIIEADGKMGQGSYATDLFPSQGVDKLTDTSSPSTQMRDGTPTGKPIIRIRDVGGVITFRFMQEPLPQPDVPTVAELGSHSLTATWQAVNGAQAYRLEARQMLSADENPVVTDENFDLMRAGSYGMADAAEMGSVLDSYLNQEGWTGEGLRQAGGRLYMGEGATLKSPLLDLSEPDGRFTVALRALAGDQGEALFTIKAQRNNGRELAVSDVMHADTDESDAVCQLTGGIGRTSVVVTVQQGELYVDRLRIEKDHVPQADVWGETAHTVAATGINTTSATLDGLLAQTTYALTLTALSDDDELSSQPSAVVLVTTKAETESVSAPTRTDAADAVTYNLAGQRLSKAVRGLFIERRGQQLKKIVR
ncbi:MAG: M6 family metalloprotease domain-containing protein [Prevotella sp.]|nr:M6 family metalloprotease domain-containing protein [Prevotella sp.]